ncbi:MAG: 2-hydroxyacid dehydrogenase [Geminicoccaceae bacterium]
MKIVVTDPLPFDETHYRRLAALGTLHAHDDRPKGAADLIARLEGCEAAVVGWCHVTREVLEALPKLRFLSLWAAGTNLVDMIAAEDHDVMISVTKGYADIAVAEFTLGTMLALTRKIWTAALRLRDGHNDWRPYLGRDLSSLTVGIVGAGSIGRQVIRLVKAFDADILVTTKHPTAVRAADLAVDFVDLDELCERSDIVSLHMPLNRETEQLLDAARLTRMKPGAFLINTSRGGLVDMECVLQKLGTDHLGGAAVDVFDVEPPEIDPAWLACENLLLTPHIAFNSMEATRRKNELCLGNIEAFVRGDPVNLA